MTLHFRYTNILNQRLIFWLQMTHAKLVSAGIDPRTALEATFGKEMADYTYKQLSEIENKKAEPNHKNN